MKSRLRLWSGFAIDVRVSFVELPTALAPVSVAG
jgi:hypothetical protein